MKWLNFLQIYGKMLFKGNTERFLASEKFRKFSLEIPISGCQKTQVPLVARMPSHASILLVAVCDIRL